MVSLPLYAFGALLIMGFKGWSRAAKGLEGHVKARSTAYGWAFTRH